MNLSLSSARFYTTTWDLTSGVRRLGDNLATKEDGESG